MNVLKWSYALIWLRSSKRKQIIEILLIRITSVSKSLADWNLIWPQNGSCSSVVTPNDRRASFQLIVARQMRPAVGPIDVDGHVRGLTSGQTRIVYCHTSRHDMERIRQRRWQELERTNLEQLTKQKSKVKSSLLRFYPESCFKGCSVARVTENICADSKTGGRSQHKCQKFSNNSRGNSLEKSCNPTLMVNFFCRCKDATMITKVGY